MYTDRVKQEMSATHEVWMQRCLELAGMASGQTAPNPLVGCVIVQGETVVGEGFHPGAGEPHAEVFALREAGDNASGATLYVNLEPCNHYGRTPPCTEAIIKAGVKRVVIGIIDPDPRVSGRGVTRLREAGVEVLEGIDANACQRLNEGFIHRVVHHRPFGILKYAMTLDGKIATLSGHSAWVTSPEARRWVHRLRGACDAIIVGGNTVRHDNPHLTTHGQTRHNPLRVVMSRQLDLPEGANLWCDRQASTVVFTSATAPTDRLKRLSSQVDVVSLEHLTPAAVMETLYQRGYATVLWECGGTLAAQAISQGCVQKVLAFVAPKLIGDGGRSPVGNLGFERMTDALDLSQVDWRPVGSDLLIEGYLA